MNTKQHDGHPDNPDWANYAYLEWRDSANNTQVSRGFTAKSRSIDVTNAKFRTPFQAGASLQLLSQNPRKSSVWAHLANSGHEVVQITASPNPLPGNSAFYGVYVDGKFYQYRTQEVQDLEKKARDRVAQEKEHEEHAKALSSGW